LHHPYHELGAEDCSPARHVIPGGFDPWTARIPMGRGGNALAVAQVALFLASEAAAYPIGQAR
jgi:NAD(P)-dependent dehydrogenase (short-subunit alcohol dehydrogenase family)